MVAVVVAVLVTVVVWLDVTVVETVAVCDVVGVPQIPNGAVCVSQFALSASTVSGATLSESHDHHHAHNFTKSACSWQKLWQ